MRLPTLLRMGAAKAEGSERVDVRRAWDSGLELILFAIWMMLVIAFVFYFSNGADSGSMAEVWPQIVIAGRVVLLHIGWGFGVYVPTLLGFYAIVVSKQWIGGQSDAARTRRNLGFVAEIFGASLIPPVLFIIAACVDNTSQLGALLVILPATGITLFLSIQLGSFLAFDSEHRRKQAMAAQEWAKESLDGLRLRSKRPKLLVILLNSGVAALVGLLFMLLLGVSYSLIPRLLLMNFIVSLVSVCIGVYGVYMRRTARGRFAAVSVWLTSILFIAFFIFLLLSVLVASPLGLAGGLGFLAIAAVTVGSTVWPLSVSFDWSIRGVGRSLAARAHVKVYGKSIRLVRELTPQPTAESPPTIGHRIRAAFQAFAA